MKSKRVWVVLVVALGAALCAGTVLATPSSGLTTTILAKSTLDETNINAYALPATWQTQIRTKGLTDIYVVDNKLAPGGTTGWHSHPGPSLILVVAGTVTNYEGNDRPTCTPHVYTAGTSFVDPGGADVHMLRNEGSVQAETIAVQLLPKDAVRRIDMPAPGNCNF